MNSRPKEELERTKVTKTGEERERETFTKAAGTGLVKDDLRGSRECRREAAKREWERGQRRNTYDVPAQHKSHQRLFV